MLFYILKQDCGSSVACSLVNSLPPMVRNQMGMKLGEKKKLTESGMDFNLSINITTHPHPSQLCALNFSWKNMISIIHFQTSIWMLDDKQCCHHFRLNRTTVSIYAKVKLIVTFLLNITIVGRIIREVLIGSREEAAKCMQNVLRRTVMVSSTRQAVSGLLAVGGVNAVRYLGNKMCKAWKSWR